MFPDGVWYDWWSGLTIEGPTEDGSVSLGSPTLCEGWGGYSHVAQQY